MVVMILSVDMGVGMVRKWSYGHAAKVQNDFMSYFCDTDYITATALIPVYTLNAL